LVSHPRSGLPAQCAKPALQALVSKVQTPPRHITVPATLSKLVQSWPQVPQLCGSLGTQAPLHKRLPPAHPPASGEAACSAPTFGSSAVSAAASAPDSGIAIATESGGPTNTTSSSVASAPASAGHEWLDEQSAKVF
jgi:hypothetical protein